MKSRPASAASLIVSRSIPPLASSSARPSTRATIARSAAGSCCRAGSAPPPRPAPRRPRPRRGTRPPAAAPGRRARASTASPTPPAAAVVLLDQDRVEEPDAMVGPAAGGNGRLLELAQPRRRLARVEDPRAGAADRFDVPRGQRRHAAQAAEGSSAVRSALSSAAPRPMSSTGSGAAPDAFRRGQNRAAGRAARTRARAVEAVEHAGLLLGDPARGRARRPPSPGSSGRRSRRPRPTPHAQPCPSPCQAV